MEVGFVSQNWSAWNLTFPDAKHFQERGFGTQKTETSILGRVMIWYSKIASLWFWSKIAVFATRIWHTHIGRNNWNSKSSQLKWPTTPHKKTDVFETHILQIQIVLFSTTVNSCERVLIVFLVLSNKHCKVKRHLNGPEGDWQLLGSSPPINQQLLHQRQEAKALAKEVWRKLSTNAARCLQTLPLSTELESSWRWKWTDWNWSDWFCAYVSKKTHLHRVHLLIYMALATCKFWRFSQELIILWTASGNKRSW